MDEKKQDVRVTKTQRSLAQALLALLEVQSFAKITINDICQEAMVSRSTFYAHFEDKYRLLHFCMQEMDRRLFASAKDREMRALLMDVLERMQKNAKTLRNLLTAELDMTLVEMMRRNFIDIYIRMLRRRGIADALPPEKLELVAAFYAAGISQSLLLWIGKKLPLSIEDMADTLCDILRGAADNIASL